MVSTPEYGRLRSGSVLMTRVYNLEVCSFGLIWEVHLMHLVMNCLFRAACWFPGERGNNCWLGRCSETNIANVIVASGRAAEMMWSAVISVTCALPLPGKVFFAGFRLRCRNVSYCYTKRLNVPVHITTCRNNLLYFFLYLHSTENFRLVVLSYHSSMSRQ